MSEQTLTVEKIPFLDLKKQYLTIKDEIRTAIDEVLDKTAFSGGPFVEKFEKNLAEYCHTKYALGLNTGTSALHMAMLALGIKEGDEVIVPANTFIATAWGVSYVNATPVFVDCDPDTWNIDVNKIEDAITPKTKAIIGVHLYGQPFDVDAVKAVAKKHNLFVVEDCAQSIGAEYKGEKTGSLAEMGCFSFYPGKNLGAYGEGGGLTTNNEEYYKHIQSLRNHGSVERYYHDELGYNFRMDGIQGAVLDVKLKYIDEWNGRRQQIAEMYRNGVNNDKIKFQKQPDWAKSVYHLMVVTTEDRDGLMKYLQANHIFPGLHYPVPCHLQKVYSTLGYKKGDMPNSEYLASHCLTLPMFSELTNEEVERIIDVLNRY
jgi:dTDP-4-amino-4,6-dideoxygalactose transaminase